MAKVTSTVSATAVATSTIPVFSLMTAALAVLKLAGIGTYSWWVVFVPLAIPIPLAIIFAVVVFLLFLAVS